MPGGQGQAAQVPLGGVIFDLDGVLVFRGRPMPGAAEAVDTVRSLGLPLRVLTNSTMKSRRACAEYLAQYGVRVAAHEIVTASSATAHYLRTLGVRSCSVMVDGSGREEFADLPVDDEAPEYLVVGDNRSAFDFDHLNRAFRMVLAGAALIGMQPELVDLSQGPPELNVGSWVEMLARAARVRAHYVGKPSPYVFHLCLEDMGISAAQGLMVGDKVSTDLVGARAAGLRCALVAAGEFDPADLTPDLQPDFLLGSIAELQDLVRRLLA